MTTVPVVWVTRGYADQGFLETVMARTVWTPPNPLTFEHHEIRGRDPFPDIPGGVVVLPARHFAEPDLVDWFRGELDRLAWSVVLLTGDEEWSFPWREVPETDRRRVWVMQPRPEHAGLSYLIPGGWYPGTHDVLREERTAAASRPLDWFFAGQVTHERRVDCADVLRSLPEGTGVLHETDGYLRGMPQPHYWRLLAGAKVIPCPSGPCTVDTARPLEALEAGCVPVVDTLTPAGDDFDYWGLVFGAGHPLTTIADWGEFPEVLDHELWWWPHNANRSFSWWQGWKRATALRLDADVRAVAGVVPADPSPDDLVTVVVSTSPIPSHPDTAVIDETLASIRAQLPRAEVLIAVDGVRPEQVDRCDDYGEYTRRLLWSANNEWANVLPLVMPEWLHQARSTARVLECVETPLVLFVEHDTPLVGNVPWAELCEVVLSGDANAVRLHHGASVLPDHRHLFRGVAKMRGVPLRQTCAWWQRPHLASTGFYRSRIVPLFGEGARSMIEDVVYGVMSDACEEPGGWDEWRVFVYSPPGDMKRSGHLDGRGSDPKYAMWL